MRCAALLLVVAFAGGCGEATTAPRAAPPPAPELEAVVASAIIALEERVPVVAETPESEQTRLHVEGLLSTLGATSGVRGNIRAIAAEELRGLGAAAVPTLHRVLVDRGAAQPQRTAVAKALSELDDPAAAAALLEFVESSRGNEDPETWLLEACARSLGETSQDWVVPRLVLCLRYETDHATVRRIAESLANFGNYAGLEALRVMNLVDALDQHALDVGLADGAALEHAWRTGENLPAAAISPARELEVWRTIRALSEWQLRGVDDGRFVLSRLGPHAADLLARALRDEDVYVRVHAAQCLERMGPRASAAGEALVSALADPALAPQAAAALGGIRHTPGCMPLIERLGPEHPLELRVAAARALAALDCTEADGPLTTLLAVGEAVDLRAAAAGCLVRSGSLAKAGAPARLLAGLLTSGEVEPTVVEADLEAWLGRGGPERVSDDVRAAWDDAAPLPEAERLERRAATIQEALD